jgi:hypothetical protein
VTFTKLNGCGFEMCSGCTNIMPKVRDIAIFRMNAHLRLCFLRFLIADFPEKSLLKAVVRKSVATA